jgi:hypothetical protein
MIRSTPRPRATAAGQLAVMPQSTDTITVAPASASPLMPSSLSPYPSSRCGMNVSIFASGDSARIVRYRIAVAVIPSTS